MKFGIYYAYWAKKWGGDFVPYVSKVKKLGFDILEVNCGDFPETDVQSLIELRNVSEGDGIILTGGYGPRPEHNLASSDPKIVDNAFKFWAETLKKMEIAGIDRIGGALYSYWPVNFNGGFDKKRDLTISIENMSKLADMASDYGVTLNMEVLNRFEGYMLNICDEAIDYVDAVNKPNVKLMLDTFHMNIEEDSMSEAIRKAGDRLGHLHVGEANRRPPNGKGRIDWKEIGDAIKETGYNQYIVMEPFEQAGGQVGKDIYIWHDPLNKATSEQLDARAAESLKFLRGIWS